MIHLLPILLTEDPALTAERLKLVALDGLQRYQKSGNDVPESEREDGRDDVRDEEADGEDGDADADFAAAELLHGGGYARIRIGLVRVVCHTRIVRARVQKRT
ncbi:hypothetical protein JCM17823_08290 [Halorubrum gandharaense]